ncbi:leucine-rich repeat-containing protein [Tanacetum coccineum]
MMTWNTSTDCCNWNGVTCNYSTGDVIGLDVSCGMLSGTINPNSSLFNLPHLQRLNLAFNYFSEQLPGEIRRFSNSLTHLNISFCLFSGQVPTDITLLSKLVSLDLSENHFDLKLHVLNNMFHNFTNLEKLSLASAHISSVLPTSLNISSSLKLLNLGYTKLQGKLPRYFFNLHSLEGLYLYGNYFTSDIPPETSLPKLVNLHIGQNDLRIEPHNINSLLKNSTLLESLHLYHCSLMGSLPESIFNLRHLNYLDLSDNNLNGILPSQLFTLPSLVHVSIEDNMFSGNVQFDSFSPSLKKLYLNQNQLVGSIDVKTFRKLTNLIVLDLSFNNFSGEWELDTFFSSLRKLYYLDLSYSGFSVTTNNANHYVNPGFRYLGLGSSKLKGFPNSVRAMKQLERLDLSRNEIHGIPHWVEEIGGNNLFYLNLSQNIITALPEFQWYGLEELYLQSNLIQGPFPQSICNMSNLLYLDMSNNHFGGLISQCFGKMTSYLDMIDMGNNNFHGTIPSLYDDCEWLVGLILNGNQLEGEVPSSLFKCRSLSVLDLGNNHLNGTFPSWLGELKNLQVLILKSNNFHGNIQPSSAVEFPFPSLQVLDLSHNEFVGKLPAKYFQNFDSMKNVVQNNSKAEYLNMGRNYYSFFVAVKGVDQAYPRLFVNLKIIDLSNNHFERGIPDVAIDQPQPWLLERITTILKNTHTPQQFIIDRKVKHKVFP